MRMLERQECWCIIGTGKGEWADFRLAPEERLQEIDAKQDEIEKGKSQPHCSGKQKHPASQSAFSSCCPGFHLFHFPSRNASLSQSMPQMRYFNEKKSSTQATRFCLPQQYHTIPSSRNRYETVTNHQMLCVFSLCLPS